MTIIQCEYVNTLVINKLIQNLMWINCGLNKTKLLILTYKHIHSADNNK